MPRTNQKSSSCGSKSGIPGRLPCLLCGSTASELSLPKFFQGVTSDCKPWPRLGRLLVCDSCGHVQKALDEAWKNDVARIYSDYQIYSLSSGVEQLVFTSSGSAARSAVILDHVRERLEIPKQGRLLDFGCGNGAFLRAFGKLFPRWEMVGADTNMSFCDEVLNIPGVAEFSGEDLSRVEGSFHLVTAIHVMEHIPDPARLLGRLRKKLVNGGLLLVQVPDFSQNPFDLLVVDHCSHFVSATLANLTHSVRVPELAVEMVDNQWIPKEISLMLRNTALSRNESLCRYDPAASLDEADRGLTWLKELAVHAREVAGRGKFGIFGTGIAGTWLAGLVGEMVEFFVDEDPLRCGKTHLGKTVLPPSAVESGGRVYMAFPSTMAETLKKRLEKAHSHVSFISPPRRPVGQADRSSPLCLKR